MRELLESGSLIRYQIVTNLLTETSLDSPNEY